MSINKENDGGFIMLGVLTFIFIISAVVFYSWQAGLLQYRISRNQYLQLKHFQMAHAGLEIAYHQLLTEQPDCEISQKSSVWFAEKSNKWWRSDLTCKGSFKGGQFQYVIVPLAINPCVHWKQRPVEFVEIFDHSGRVNSTVLSATYIKSIRQHMSCKGKLINLNKTRIAWRQL